MPSVSPGRRGPAGFVPTPYHRKIKIRLKRCEKNAAGNLRPVRAAGEGNRGQQAEAAVPDAGLQGAAVALVDSDEGLAQLRGHGVQLSVEGVVPGRGVARHLPAVRGEIENTRKIL